MEKPSYGVRARNKIILSNELLFFITAGRTHLKNMHNISYNYTTKQQIKNEPSQISKLAMAKKLGIERNPIITIKDKKLTKKIGCVLVRKFSQSAEFIN